jgi:hypothetical protein
VIVQALKIQLGPLTSKQREEVHGKTKEQLKKTLELVGGKIRNYPSQSFEVIHAIADVAEQAGDDTLAATALHLIDEHKDTKNTEEGGISQAAKTIPDFNAPDCFFITPPSVGDQSLSKIVSAISKNYSTWRIQPSVHPTGKMESGIEVVYYSDNDKKTAENLFKLVAEQLNEKTTAPNIRKSTAAAKGSQYDIHIGPNLALKLADIKIIADNPANLSHR